MPSSKIFRGSEEQLLARFWELVGPSKRGLPRLVTFNGRGYDGPVLTIRSAQLGLKPSRSLMGNRYSIAEHCDLSDIFSFRARRASATSSTTGAGASTSRAPRARSTARASRARLPAPAASTTSASTACATCAPPPSSTRSSRTR
ncbi:MAG: hypothetical protein IPJ19_18955 [Planctomycetes bacterium]|nr:hypothetical protein [Planctomycetota bacterium]